jgi:prepilin-type N-terminal cleavage/methylation domain-containing protein
MKKMNKKGFTLIEMLAVIAIIAVLVAIIVPAVGSSTTKAKASTDAANLRSVLSAATIEYAENGDLSKLNVTAPASKLDDDLVQIEIYMNGDEMVAYYTNGSNKYVTITALSAIADDSDTDKTLDVATAAPTGTNVKLLATVAASGTTAATEPTT